ncbi:MAG: DUF2934 domain-containing protein [Terracidiphilus sp.]|nr:DUF2934 domain-containing protein [Terracidiphilus sp.]
MADTVKKAATPRKPRTTAKTKAEAAAPAAAKPATKKKAVPKGPKAAKATVTPIRKSAAKPKVTRDEIAALAHRFWLERGGQHGHHEEDWLRAEQTLLGKAS